MSRRLKGVPLDSALDKAYPHQVIVPVPGGGLGALLDTMHAFADALGPNSNRSLGDLRESRDQDGFRMCFETEEAADAFANEFGLKRHTVGVKGRR